MMPTDIPGYDSQDKHGFGDCDLLENWLGDNGFECRWEKDSPSSGVRAWWNESAGLLVLTQPFRHGPELGEFQVIECASVKDADYQTSEWWRE